MICAKRAGCRDASGASASAGIVFPSNFPPQLRRALVLAVAAAGFVCLPHPTTSAGAGTAANHCANRSWSNSILSPIVHAMEKDLQRTMTLIKSNPDSPPDKVRPGQAATTDDLGRRVQDQGSNPENGQQDSQEANAGDQMQDQSPSGMQGAQGEAKPSDSEQQEGGDSQSQQSSNGTDRMGGDTQQQSETPNSENSRQSLSKSLMQALKSMLSTRRARKGTTRRIRSSQFSGHAAIGQFTPTRFRRG